LADNVIMGLMRVYSLLAPATCTTSILPYSRQSHQQSKFDAHISSLDLPTYILHAVQISSPYPYAWKYKHLHPTPLELGPQLNRAGLISPAVHSKFIICTTHSHRVPGCARISPFLLCLFPAHIPHPKPQPYIRAITCPL
jgi:hypothetical protein